jgi:hypothetical protein
MSSNGRLPADELTKVQGEITLHNSIVYSWQQLVAACKADTGVTPIITVPYGGYRDLDAQQAMQGHYKPVAPVGTSVHGYGKSVDIYNWARIDDWLDRNANRYGFYLTINKEPWHYQCLRPLTPPPTPTPRKRKMSLIDTIYTDHNATFYIVNLDGCHAIPLGARDTWNQEVLGYIDAPWADTNIPYLGILAGAPEGHSTPALLTAWLNGRGIPTTPTPDNPYHFPRGGGATPTAGKFTGTVDFN